MADGVHQIDSDFLFQIEIRLQLIPIPCIDAPHCPAGQT